MRYHQIACATYRQSAQGRYDSRFHDPGDSSEAFAVGVGDERSTLCRCVRPDVVTLNFAGIDHHIDPGPRGHLNKDRGHDCLHFTVFISAYKESL